MKREKVLFLTKYPKIGASSRYRVYQYLPYFKRFDFQAQALLSEEGFKLIYEKGKITQKIRIGLRDYIRRSFFILKNLDAKVIYMQREIFAFGPLWAEHLFKLLGKKLIFDLDDALFIHKQNKTNPFRWNKTGRIEKILGISDLVIAGNDWIRDECIRIGAKKGVHIDVAEEVMELEKRTMGSSENNRLRVLWLGSPTTSKYLKIIEQALQKLQEKINLDIYLVGSDVTLQFAFQAKRVDWSLENEKKYLSICDIGLMPLPDEIWSKGKCGGKARTYMAAGLIPIVSNIGYNQTLIKNGARGFLCDNIIDDWVEAIIKVHEDRALIIRIGQENRKYIIEHFNRAKIAKEIESQIITLLN